MSINWGKAALDSLMRGRLLPVRVTQLEMVEQTSHKVPQPVDSQATIIKVKNCPSHFYRYLYDRIGRRHHWAHRLKMREENLSAILHAPQTILHVLYLDGVPSGFCETNLNAWPDMEIVYFGLMAEFQGRGWGRFFLNEMITESWKKHPKRLLIQTNTLDSPHALKLYEEFGFKRIMVRDVMMQAVPQNRGLYS